jgi:DNA-binding transcriptional regulator YiaG
MSSVAKALKDEITRLARKEIRSQIEPVRKAAASHRHQIAELKRTVGELQREIKALGRARPAAKPAEVSGKPTRFVAKGLRSLGERLGMSAEDLGALVGVSGQSIRNWIQQKSTPGKEHRAALIALRSIGKREATARLQQIREKTAKTARNTAKD